MTEPTPGAERPLPDPYDVLEIPGDAGNTLIDAAYLRLSRKYQAEGDRERLEEVRLSFDLLRSPAKRAELDLQRSETASAWFGMPIERPGTRPPRVTTPTGLGPLVRAREVEGVLGDVRWGAREVGLGVLMVVGIFFALVLAILIPLELAGVNVDDEPAVGLVLNAASLYVPLLFVPWLFARRAGSAPARALGFRPLPWSASWRIPVGLFTVYLAVLIPLAILSGFGVESEGNVPDDLFEDDLTVILSFLVVGLMAPFAEETFFRGFVFAGLARSYHLLIAMAASGLLFGIVHFDFVLFLPFSLVGVVLAWTYVKSNSLWANIAVHAAFNLVSLTVGVLSR